MAISDKLTTLNGIKSDIKAAIIAKGGTATDDFTTYATAISNLPSGGGSDDLKNLIERDITSITIPAGTTTIGKYAFCGCSGLTSVTIPNSVTSIGDGAFDSCIYLSSITIPNSVTSIGISAFSTCRSLTSINIPNSLGVIQNQMFYNCNGLTSVTLGNSVAAINSRAFSGCTSLTSITCLATTPPTIQSNTFQNVPADCAIYVPAESVLTYKAANYWSTRASYIFPIQIYIQAEYTTDTANQQVTITNNQELFKFISIDGVFQITDTGTLTHTFTNTGVHTVQFVLVDTTEIGSSAFMNCYEMTSVRWGSSITTIGSGAFSGCENLYSISSDATTPPTISNDTFDNVPEDCPIYVPSANVSDYQNALYWDERGAYIEAIP